MVKTMFSSTFRFCRWHTVVDKVQAALPPTVKLKPWRMHIFSQLPYPDNYKSFKMQRGDPLHPIQRPEKLPALPAGLDLGQLPSVTDLEAAVTAAFSSRQAPEVKPSHNSPPAARAACFLFCHYSTGCLHALRLLAFVREGSVEGAISSA